VRNNSTIWETLREWDKIAMKKGKNCSTISGGFEKTEQCLCGRVRWWFKKGRWRHGKGEPFHSRESTCREESLRLFLERAAGLGIDCPPQCKKWAATNGAVRAGRGNPPSQKKMSPVPRGERFESKG